LVAFAQAFNLVEGTFYADFRELVSSFSHVVDGEVISLEELEVVDTETND